MCVKITEHNFLKTIGGENRRGTIKRYHRGVDSVSGKTVHQFFSPGYALAQNMKRNPKHRRKVRHDKV